MKTSFNFVKASSLIVLALGFLPGCKLFDLFKKKEAASKAAVTKPAEEYSSVELCSINGTTAITEKEYLSNLNQTLQANPMFQGASADSLPTALKRQFFDELVKQELILVDAKKQNIEADPEFQRELDDIMKLIKRTKVIQFFEKQLYDAISITDSDIESNYKDNRETYIKVPGGLQTFGVKFNTDAQAKAFAAKALPEESAFEKAAQEEKSAQYRPFGRLGKASGKAGYPQNMTPIAIRDAALKDGKLPRIERVANGKEHWVVLFTDKKEAVYFELNEIKPQIGNMLKAEKFKAALEDKIKKLNNEMTVNINEAYFKEKEAAEMSQDKTNSANPSISA